MLLPINKIFNKVFLKSGALVCYGIFACGIYAFAFESDKTNITPSLEVAQSYDDNVSYTSREEKSDFITRISPGIQAQYETKNASWDMYADVTASIFARNSEFNNLSEHIKLNGEVELSKHDRLSLSDSFAHTYEPATFDQAFARTLGRYSYYTNDIEVEYIRDITRQMSIRTTYANEMDIVSRADMSDSVLNRLAVQLDYVFGSSVSCNTELMFAHRDFDPGIDAEQVRWDAALIYSFSKLTSVTFTAGYDDFFMRSKDYVRPVLSVSFDHDVSRNLTVDITLKKQYELNSYSQELFDCWRASSFLNYHLTPKLSTGVGLYYGKGTYVPSRIDETFIGSEIQNQYELDKDTMVNCAYMYSRNTSNDNDREYTKNRVSLGFKKLF